MCMCCPYFITLSSLGYLLDLMTHPIAIRLVTPLKSPLHVSSYHSLSTYSYFCSPSRFLTLICREFELNSSRTVHGFNILRARRLSTRTCLFWKRRSLHSARQIDVSSATTSPKVKYSVVTYCNGSNRLCLPLCWYWPLGAFGKNENRLLAGDSALIANPPVFLQRDMLSRINILGVVTLLQGLLTMGLSWMIFLRSETAQVRQNWSTTKSSIQRSPSSSQQTTCNPNSCSRYPWTP